MKKIVFFILAAMLFYGCGNTSTTEDTNTTGILTPPKIPN